MKWQQSTWLNPTSTLLCFLLVILFLGGCSGGAATPATVSPPSPVPTLAPTSTPTDAPTTVSTLVPTPAATPVPTETPTEIPTQVPTAAPTDLPTPEPVEDADPTLIALGVEVYRSRYCGICHTLTVANTRGTFAPNHDHVATHAQEHLSDPGYSGSATTVEEYLLESLLEPQRYFVPGYELSPHAMPTFSHLSDEELVALVAMLAAQK